MKRIKWTAILAVLSLLLSLCLCACTGEATPEETSKVTTPRTTRTTRRVIDVTIEELLTRERMEAAMSIPMREPTVTHNGTHLYALSEDGSISVQVALDKQTVEQFERLVGENSSADSTPNLGQQAWWLSDKQMLIVHQGDYTLSVSITGGDYSDDDALFVSRQLAAAVVEQLPA